jgi:hypothetical protein
MADVWFCAQDGVRLGPFTTRELRDRAVAGRILPTDMIWKEGVVTGALAKDVKNLWPASGADSLPPVSAAGSLVSAVESTPQPASVSTSSETHSPSPDDAILRSEEAPPRSGRRPPPPEKVKTGTATAGKGAIIVGQDGTRVNYKKKCTVCGHEDPGRHNMLIRQGWTRASYYCPKCRKARPVEILGATR